jgi:hypothetical protein
MNIGRNKFNLKTVFTNIEIKRDQLNSFYFFNPRRNER